MILLTNHLVNIHATWTNNELVRKKILKQKTRSTPCVVLRESISHEKYVSFSFNAHHHTRLPLFTRAMAAHENTPNTQNVMKMMASITMGGMPKT